MILGIFDDGKIKTYETVAHALNAGAVFSSIINIKELKSNENREFEIQFYKSTTESICLQYGNWKVANRKLIFQVRHGFHYKQRVNIVDKFGQIDFIEIRDFLAFDIVKNINDSLRQLSSFNSWDEFRLKEEIDILKDKIKNLESKSE